MKQVYVVYDAMDGRDVCAFAAKKEAEHMAEALSTADRYAVFTIPLSMCGATMDDDLDEYEGGE